jgi:hypothetical protein
MRARAQTRPDQTVPYRVVGVPLAAALWCRFDHPVTDCTVVGAEIDRRLDGPGSR